jgi:small GTP-binding protein
VSAPSAWGASKADAQLNRARASIKWAIAHYTKQLREKRRTPLDAERQVILKGDLERLDIALNRITGQTLKVAVFGLVSRGKSAVINALVGQKLLQTGPVHGVTRWPRSVYWTPLATANERVQASLDSAPQVEALPQKTAAMPPALSVELIDTPGLEEVEGEDRAAMAADVAHQADLILFVISGDITRTEYEAIANLHALHKPLLVVFNKIDLYPGYDRQAIVQNINALLDDTDDATALALDNLVCVAAEPAPIQVKTEWPDGSVTYDWEAAPPQIDDLRETLLTLLQRDGKLLLALNALREVEAIEQGITQTSLSIYQDDAEELIWKFASWKAIAVAVNPIAVLDVAGGSVADLVMIRSLAKLYGLPMTGHEANKLWNAVVWSSLSLAVGEIGSSLLLGVGKSAAAFASVFESVTGLAAYSTAAIAQATLAGYGTYRVGKAAQAYLENGCSWGPKGSRRVIQDITSQLDRDSLLARLQSELLDDEMDVQSR